MKPRLLFGTVTAVLVLIMGQSVHGEENSYYMNPNGGKYYHCERECKTIRSTYYAEMIEITEEQLAEEPYTQLTKCNVCFNDDKANEILSGTTKFFYRSEYDTAETDKQYFAGIYHSGMSIMPGIYTAKSDAQCIGTLEVLDQDMQQLAIYELTGECSITFYLGKEMSIVVPENCVLQKVVYAPAFQEAYQQTTIRHGRYVTMLEIPGLRYCVKSIAGEAGYYAIATIQSEMGKESVPVVEIADGETVELNLQGAYDVFVEFVNCIMWPSEKGDG